MIGQGRLYTVTFVAVSITLAQDLFYLRPAADKPIWLEAVTIAASGGTADAGDAQEELYDIRITRLAATITAGTGGAAPTPAPVDLNDAAAGFTARTNDATTRATTTGATTTLHADGMNSRVPYQFLPPPEHRPPCAGAALGLVVGLNTAPADAILVSGTAYVREMP